MEVRLLGSVEVVADDRRVELGPPQRRAVFAALAVDAGQLVPLPTLTGRVWDDPPNRATDSLYAHITRLRQALAEVGLTIERRSGGYVLRIDRGLVDVHRFHGLTRRAQRAARDAAARAALLDQAIGMWRGMPLTDVPGDWAARLRHGIEQQYVSAVVGWADAQLRLGRAAQVVTEITPLVLRYPLVEPLSGMLMRGLCALGRTAEALAHYARLRGHLVEQLGIEPGPELRALHEEILRADRDGPPERTAALSLPSPPSALSPPSAPSLPTGTTATAPAGAAPGRAGEAWPAAELDRLTAEEALALLRRIVGDRIETDPIGAATLVERCARLPLALRIAGELALARPTVGLAELGDQLAAAASASAGFNPAGFDSAGLDSAQWDGMDRPRRHPVRRSRRPARTSSMAERHQLLVGAEPADRGEADGGGAGRGAVGVARAGLTS